MVFCLKQAQNRPLILIRYLKGLSLSFQKIRKLTLLDQLNQVMAVQKCFIFCLRVLVLASLCN